MVSIEQFITDNDSQLLSFLDGVEVPGIRCGTQNYQHYVWVTSAYRTRQRHGFGLASVEFSPKAVLELLIEGTHIPLGFDAKRRVKLLSIDPPCPSSKVQWVHKRVEFYDFHSVGEWLDQVRPIPQGIRALLDESDDSLHLFVPVLKSDNRPYRKHTLQISKSSPQRVLSDVGTIIGEGNVFLDFQPDFNIIYLECIPGVPMPQYPVTPKAPSNMPTQAPRNAKAALFNGTRAQSAGLARSSIQPAAPSPSPIPSYTTTPNYTPTPSYTLTPSINMKAESAAPVVQKSATVQPIPDSILNKKVRPSSAQKARPSSAQLKRSASPGLAALDGVTSLADGMASLSDGVPISYPLKPSAVKSRPASARGRPASAQPKAAVPPVGIRSTSPGLVSPDQAQCGFTSLPTTEAGIRNLFNLLDRDGNDHLSKDEFKQFYNRCENFGLEESESTINSMLASYRALSDDVLSYDEFAILCLKLAQR